MLLKIIKKNFGILRDNYMSIIRDKNMHTDEMQLDVVAIYHNQGGSFRKAQGSAREQSPQLEGIHQGTKHAQLGPCSESTQEGGEIDRQEGEYVQQPLPEIILVFIWSIPIIVGQYPGNVPLRRQWVRQKLPLWPVLLPSQHKGEAKGALPLVYDRNPYLALRTVTSQANIWPSSNSGKAKGAAAKTALLRWVPGDWCGWREHPEETVWATIQKRISLAGHQQQAS